MRTLVLFTLLIAAAGCQTTSNAGKPGNKQGLINPVPSNAGTALRSSAPQNRSRADRSDSNVGGEPLLEDLQTPALQDSYTRRESRTQTGEASSAKAGNAPIIQVEPASAATDDRKLIEVEHLSGSGSGAARPATATTEGDRATSQPWFSVTRQDAEKPQATVESSMTMLQHSLRGLRDKLQRELATYSGVDERTLDDAARLTKHNLEIRLAALHFVEGNTEPSQLAQLLDSIRSPHHPGEVHSLLRAALYHDVGSEGLRDQAVAGMRGARTGARFDLTSVELCRSIDNRGGRKKYSEYTFKPDQAIHVYGELLNLSAVKTKDGFLSKVRIDVQLVKDHVIKDSRRLGEFNDVQRTKRDSNFFARIYRLPMLIQSGSYELHVIATDLSTDPYMIVEQSVPIRIEK